MVLENVGAMVYFQLYSGYYNHSVLILHTDKTFLLTGDIYNTFPCQLTTLDITVNL
jgi:hypothetical protein